MHRPIVFLRPLGLRLLQFDLDLDILYNISQSEYKEFPSVDIEWADFIVSNRMASVPVHSYRWTYGGMADGPTAYLCGKRHRGEISTEELLYGYIDSVSNEEIRGILPYKEHYDQLVFHDEIFVNSGVLKNCRLAYQMPNIANMSRRG